MVKGGIGFPSDVAGSVPGFTSIKSDTWLAHTRQPTNSPGSYPIFSHPFSSVNISAVHNGDVSSFGANVNALRNLGYRSFVGGTDSEVIVRLLFVLMHRFRMPAEEALQVLAGTHPLSNEFPGLSLDGPFSVAFSFMEGGMRKIAAVADRSKLRPLLVGTDGGGRVVVASELNQVKRLIGNPEVRRLKGGGEVMVADRHGIRYC
ncbi:hypothetical protein [Thermogymnomonas acidicola]|uniref:hypothetical protein n=1 Tax=Thermogymnomonas acidicola TaxID=399579 RepID=UPI00094672EE|nr:hypothetical protein [Thermogymnomonas acidicola]